MSLKLLPTELIRQVLEACSPRAYECLMLSCRTIYESGRIILESHNDLCRRYRHFSYGGEVECSLQLLSRVMKDPPIAEYIEVANLLDDDSTVQLRSGSQEHVCGFVHDSNASNALVETLKGSVFLRQADVDAMKWFETICEGHRSNNPQLLATALLLSLMPNVKELILPRFWARLPPPIGNTEFDERVELWRVLDAIALHSASVGSDERPLSKLARIQRFHLIAHHAPVGLQILSPFLILPSLRELGASNCVANRARFTGKPFNWRYPAHASSLEKITFASCCIDGSELANLLCRTPNLRCFQLSYETKWHGCGEHWAANELFLSLSRHCGHTLTTLSVTIERLGGVLKGGLRSLKEFAKLEHLELDVRVFFGPPVTDDLRDMSPLDFRNYAYANGWNGAMVPSLADVLPSTIKTVRLIAGSSREDVLILKSLFANLDGSVRERLPRLETLQVSRARLAIGGQDLSPDQYQSAWRSAKEVVSSAGYLFHEADIVRASWLDEFCRS